MSLLTAIRSRMREYKELGDKTFAQLTDADLHYRPNPESNSIAVIIRHMQGNMLSRWTHFLTEDGEKPWRQRDAEFEPSAAGKEQLLQSWEEGWAVFLGALDSLTDADLESMVRIRGQQLTVTDALIRQVAHYASHVGQILYIGKMVKGAEWHWLSIPPRQSEAFNQQMNPSNKPHA